MLRKSKATRVLAGAFPLLIGAGFGYAQVSVFDASIAKVERFEQTGPSTVGADDWQFRAAITFDSSPTGAVTLSSPSTGPFTLGPDPIDPDAREGEFSFAGKSALDADFPFSATYTFDYGSTHTLDLGADDYPALAAPPQVSSATYTGAQSIDPTLSFDLDFEPRNGALFDFIGIDYTDAGTRYPIDVVSTATDYTIAAGDLPADSDLEIHIAYTKISGSGPNGTSGYILETSLPATTLVPEPASAPWLVGMVALALVGFRRKESRGLPSG